MTENPVTSASYATEIFPLPALVLLSVALTLLVVVAYGLADFCWSCLENQVDILLDQDRRLHDVERGQAPGKEGGAATVIILRLPVFQIDETTEFFSNGCAICLEDFQKGVDCCVLSSCKHVFHSSCLKQWLEVDLTCPLCRNYTFDDMFLC